MFEFLKNSFRRRSLRRHACNEPTGILPLGEVRTVAVILDAADPSFEDCRQALRAFFSEHKMKGDLFITGTDDNNRKKECNWFGQPSREIISRLRDMRADLCISLLRDASFPVEFMVKCTPARFKIGRVQLPGSPFDLVVSDPAGQALSQLDSFHSIRQMLEKII